MVSPITFSGLASGIDSSSLIKALLDRERAARITPLQNKITALKDTNDAFGELGGLLGKLKSAADKFRVVNGGVLNKSGNSSDETVLSAAASNSSQNGSYSISVTQLAKNATASLASTSVTYSSSTQAINANINDGDPNRTVSVQIGSGSDQETVNIDLTSTTTLSDYVTQFNNSSTKAVASVINVGTTSSPDYRVVISSNNTGLSKGQISINVGSEVSDPDGNGGTNDGAFNSNTISQATDAQFSIAGIGNISRSSNSVSDVLSGITFNLKGEGDATVTVHDNTSATMGAVQDLVSSYNEVVKYIKEKDLITEEGQGNKKVNVFGPLANTSLDENVLSALRAGLTGASKSGGLVNTLADLGITTERDGTLKFDSNTFQTAVSNESASVRSITETLGETLAATNGIIAQFTRYNGLIDSTKNSNISQISSYENNIGSIEKTLSKEEESLNARFSRLEAIIGQYQSQQNSLSSLLRT